ncbi:MAG: polyprenyl synthetase family protein [Candidatus Bathyarchaeota archaeon]|nr:MAG: polyprenyl synthetase family protein [Candidatus Bathyarchaeota archaeon]
MARVEKETSKSLIQHVQRILEERSSSALKIAKQKMLQQRIRSKEINAALEHYIRNWMDITHPGLLSIACEAAGGDSKQSIPIQVVMLLLTAGIDIHDDIIDESQTKYGKPTVLAKFGREIALLVGDAFLMKALLLLHEQETQLSKKKRDDIWSLIGSRFFELGDAEALEASLKGKMNITPEDALKILMMKAATFDAHMRIGAIVGGGNQDVVDLLGNYGRVLGALLCVREEFIDVFEPEELANRARNECLPLPILYAFKNPHAKRAILNSLSKPKISSADAEKIVEIVFDDENVKTLRNKIAELVEEGCANLQNLPDDPLKLQMETLIRGVIGDL